MAPTDERYANEAGLQWDGKWSSINPAYFDMADLRIEHIVGRGLVPCIFGAWGPHIKQMGTEKMKRHWRYLVARYGAYPVVWSLSGEALSTSPESTDKEGDKKLQVREWTVVARYVRETDGYGRLFTVHPVETARIFVEKLESGVTYNALLFDPATGDRVPAGKVRGDNQGRWEVPQPPIGQDWVVVLECA